MTKKDRLLSAFSRSTKAGGGIHTTHELAFMMGEKYTPAFTKLLADCVRKKLLRRVSKGLFESTLTPPEPTTAIYKIIKKLKIENVDSIAEAVLHHHEYYCGSGYPHQLSKEHIPILSRIIAVGDSYDGMTDTRPYHHAKTHTQAMDIISSESGYKFDPYVVRKFESIIKTSNQKGQ